MRSRRWPKVAPDGVRERDEPPLSDDALLVRGGQFRVPHVLQRAQLCERRLGFAGVSVALAVTGRLADLCDVSPGLLDYDECSLTTAGRLRSRFRIAPTGASPHCSIILPAADIAAVRALRDLFDTGVPLPPTGTDR